MLFQVCVKCLLRSLQKPISGPYLVTGFHTDTVQHDPMPRRVEHLTRNCKSNIQITPRHGFLSVWRNFRYKRVILADTIWIELFWIVLVCHFEQFLHLAGLRVYTMPINLYQLNNLIIDKRKNNPITSFLRLLLDVKMVYAASVKKYILFTLIPDFCKGDGNGHEKGRA